MKMNNKISKEISIDMQSYVSVSNPSTIRSSKNAVIYTRVSSKEQAEENTSLTSQKKACEEFCNKKESFSYKV